MVDTHCHLYLNEFKADIDEVIKRAGEETVNKFYLPGIDSTEIENMFLLESRFPGKCIAMMGLHPCSVKENYLDELEIVKDWLTKRKFAAVGEIGLDFYWDKTYTAQQYEAFRTQIDLSLKFDLPIVIHTRNAMQETIDVVKNLCQKESEVFFIALAGVWKMQKKL